MMSDCQLLNEGSGSRNQLLSRPQILSKMSTIHENIRKLFLEQVQEEASAQITSTASLDVRF